MRALVVGGTGFLGLNVLEALRDAGHEAACTRRRSSNTILARRLRVPLVQADLDDPEGLVRAMDGRDVVFMTAGHYPRYSVDTAAEVETAVRRLDHVLRAAREAGVGRVVYTGTVATVGRPADGSPATEADGRPEVPDGSTYFAVKLALDRRIRQAVDAGQDVVELCPTACLGPYDYKVGTGFFVAGMLNGRLPYWVDGPVDVVDAADVARAHVEAARRGRTGERYILGGHGTTVRVLLDTIARRWHTPPPGRELSVEAARALADEEEARCLRDGGRPLLSREMVDLAAHGQHVDCGRARTELGHRPRPLEDTIDRSCRWYLENGFVPRRAARDGGRKERTHAGDPR
ncbi:MAG: NAD-dependent epimerase/dehydratase family protein [Myxococcota bacterium]